MQSTQLKEIRARDIRLGDLRLPGCVSAGRGADCSESASTASRSPSTLSVPKQGHGPGGWEPCSRRVCWMGRTVQDEAFVNFFASYKIMVSFCRLNLLTQLCVQRVYKMDSWGSNAYSQVSLILHEAQYSYNG